MSLNYSQSLWDLMKNPVIRNFIIRTNLLVEDPGKVATALLECKSTHRLVINNPIIVYVSPKTILTYIRKYPQSLTAITNAVLDNNTEEENAHLARKISEIVYDPISYPAEAISRLYEYDYRFLRAYFKHPKVTTEAKKEMLQHGLRMWFNKKLKPQEFYDRFGSGIHLLDHDLILKLCRRSYWFAHNVVRNSDVPELHQTIWEQMPKRKKPDLAGALIFGQSKIPTSTLQEAVDSLKELTKNLAFQLAIHSSCNIDIARYVAVEVMRVPKRPFDMTPIKDVVDALQKRFGNQLDTVFENLLILE